MDNVAVALPAPAPSTCQPGHLRLADVLDLDGDEGDGPTRLFSPDPSYRGLGAETAITAASEPAPEAPAGGHLLSPAAREVTAVSVAPVDRTLVSTPKVKVNTQITERPILRTPPVGSGFGTQVSLNPVMLTPPVGSGFGTQVGPRPTTNPYASIAALDVPMSIAASSPTIPDPVGPSDSGPIDTDVEIESVSVSAPALGVPSPIAAEPAALRTTPVRAARVVVAGRYLDLGDDISEHTHALGGSMLIARTPTSAFADDPYVDAEHGALTFRPDGVAVEDFDSTNGLFVRVRGRMPLRCGDLFRAGEQLLRFTSMRGIRAQGRAPMLGSPDPGYWGRIDVMIAEDNNAASYPVDDTEIGFGQTDGHLQFPDDPFLGAMHCSVRKEEKGASLLDHGAEAGTWLRLRAGDVVPYGSELLVGQTILRLERA